MNIKDSSLPDEIKTKIKSSSIENFMDVLVDKNQMEYINLMSTINIPRDINPVFYATYIPSDKETFQTISYKFYNTITLWWLICIVNRIMNATEGAVAGVPLKIIKKEYVNSILTNI